MRPNSLHIRKHNCCDCNPSAAESLSRGGYNARLAHEDGRPIHYALSGSKHTATATATRRPVNPGEEKATEWKKDHLSPSNKSTRKTPSPVPFLPAGVSTAQQPPYTRSLALPPARLACCEHLSKHSSSSSSTTSQRITSHPHPPNGAAPRGITKQGHPLIHGRKVTKVLCDLIPNSPIAARLPNRKRGCAAVQLKQASSQFVGTWDRRCLIERLCLLRAAWVVSAGN